MRVRIKVNGVVCSKREIADRWEIGKGAIATVALREVATRRARVIALEAETVETAEAPVPE